MHAARTLACACALVAMPAVTVDAAGINCRPHETEIFACTLKSGRKSVSVCQNGPALTYRYGPPEGPAELTLTSPMETLDAHPWSGIGRAIFESVTFTNSSYGYEGGMGLDKFRALEGENGRGGAVTILQGQTTLQTLACDDDTARYEAFSLEDAFKAQGFCWNTTDYIWQRDCPD